MTGPSTDQLSNQFDLQGPPASVTRSNSRVPLAKLDNEKLPAYSLDDGPLTTAEIHAIQAELSNAREEQSFFVVPIVKSFLLHQLGWWIHLQKVQGKK